MNGLHADSCSDSKARKVRILVDSVFDMNTLLDDLRNAGAPKDEIDEAERELYVVALKLAHVIRCEAR
jgi:hypothetical protein